jgi:hypothetical protein
MDGRSLPRLRPVSANSKNSWCAKPLEALTTCRQQKKQNEAKNINDNDDCKKQQQSAQQCEAAVERAYRHLNLGTACLRQNQMVTVCQVEWCDNGKASSSSRADAAAQECQQECSRVRKVLEECIQKYVQSFLPPPVATAT